MKNDSSRKRSVWQWALLLAYAYLSVAGWLRLGGSVANWEWLARAGVKPGPLYIALTGGLWGILGLVGAVWILARLRGWRRVGVAAAALFALSYWADRLLAASPDGNMANLVFAAGLTLVVLGCVALILQGETSVTPARREHPVDESFGEKR